MCSSPTLADEREHLAIVRRKELQRPPSECLVALPERDQALHPPQQRLRVRLLDLDVDGLEVILGVGDDREIERLAVRLREARVSIGGPLHGCSDAVAIAQVDVVAHADLVAVVEDRRAGQ